MIKARKDYNASLAIGLSAIETRAKIAKEEMLSALQELIPAKILLG